MTPDNDGEAVVEVASGLRAPEGPVWLPDGRVLVVEQEAGRISACQDGERTTIAMCGGGPNGAAIGPDGALYVCNNGGAFTYTKRQGLMIPGHAPAHHSGGRIERVNISTGKVEVLYEFCDD